MGRRVGPARKCTVLFFRALGLAPALPSSVAPQQEVSVGRGERLAQARGHLRGHCSCVHSPRP